MAGPLKKSRMDYGSSSEYDDDDVKVIEDTKNSQKKAAAVEKGMDNNQLVPYFNRYVLLMRYQRQGKKAFGEEQLHDFIAELFHSLEYKNDQSDGK
jgi:hypothetical protein